MVRPCHSKIHSINTKNADCIDYSLFGDLKGKRVLHLQSLLGTESIEFAKAGAKVTAVECSEPLIMWAKEICKSYDVEPEFILSDIQDLSVNVTGEYDIIFSSYGSLSWIPDMPDFFQSIYNLLAPGGEFVLTELHPFMKMSQTLFSQVDYQYFSDEYRIKSNVTTELCSAETEFLPGVFLNSPLKDVFSLLLGLGFDISKFTEYQSTPFDIMDGVVEFLPGKYKTEDDNAEMPLTFSLVAVKNTDA